MLSTIQQLLEKQDTQTLTAALLHSSRWLLGERLHYGPIQQRGLMANWLDITTHFETVELCAKVQSGDVEAGVFCLSSASTTTYFIAQCKHRNGAIKQLLQWVDSASLAAHYNTKEAPGYDNSMSLPFWPEPDPLQLSEFDPQLHLKTTHAGINDVVASNTSDKSKALMSQWWQVWQGFDTAGIKELYSDATHISVNSQVLNKEGSPSVSSWLTLLEGKLHRRYCQLEQVIADESNALVKWRIDADLKTDNGLIRVRLPIATMLTFKENKITTEYWVVDSIAFEKRFGAPLPF